MNWKVHLAGAAFVAVTGVAAAWAADYPFTGLFNFPPDEVSATDAPLYCGYNFFAQNTDGSYTTYHLDLSRYRKDATIRYLVFTRGSCSVDAKNVENCTTTWDVDPKNRNQSFADVIEKNDKDQVQVAFFDRLADAQSFSTSGKPEPTGTGRYFRCPFDQATIAKYRTEEESTISEDERQALTVPKLDDATRATMTKVLDAIRAGQ